MLTTNKDTAFKDVKNSAANIRDEAIETGYEVKDDLRAAANQAGRKVRGFFNNASDEIQRASDVVTAEVRKNPVQSSLIALGAGFVLGALFRR